MKMAQKHETNIVHCERKRKRFNPFKTLNWTAADTANCLYLVVVDCGGMFEDC